jgi:hypothetical protein
MTSWIEKRQIKATLKPPKKGFVVKFMVALFLLKAQRKFCKVQLLLVL